ncbi:hypothetical protein A3K79_02530 [Candidatus Bathyarchaeota archaeon RBG_13_46_16b]|nr:MAG: hypothetical protein A3K79_02530 [Candidatus Bathyarchaeota archaeon RBG_13_46_16b]
MKNRTTLLVGLTLTMLLCGIFLGKAQADLPTTILKIEAPAEVPTGGTFTASVIAQDVTNLYGWEFIANWTAGTINCTGETLNTALWTDYLGPWVAHPIDNTKGEYAQSLTARLPAVAVNGTFWLTNVTFQVIKGPCNITDLNLKLAPGYTAYCLVDFYAEEIPHQFVKASVHVIIPEFATFLMLPLLMLFSTSSLVIAKKMRKRR